MPQSKKHVRSHIRNGKRVKGHMRKTTRKKPKLGTGKRFADLEHKLAEKGATNPDALAAWIGRKNYGKKRFAKLSANG